MADNASCRLNKRVLKNERLLEKLSVDMEEMKRMLGEVTEKLNRAAESEESDEEK